MKSRLVKSMLVKTTFLLAGKAIAALTAIALAAVGAVFFVSQPQPLLSSLFIA